MTNIIMPLLVYLVVGVVLVFVAVRRRAEFEKRTLLRLLFMGLMVRLAAAVVFETVPSTRNFHEDAEGYQHVAVMLSQSWKGTGPEYELSRTINYGYNYLCAAQSFLLGDSRSAPVFGNCIFGILAAFYVFLIARRFFGLEIARMALKLTLFFPSMIVWSSVAMKDVVMQFLILSTVYHVLLLRERFGLRDTAMVAAALVAVFTIRYYMLYMLLFSIAASTVLSASRFEGGRLGRQLALMIVFAIGVAAVGMDTEARSGVETLTVEKVGVTRRGLSTTARSGFGPKTEIRTRGEALALMPLGLFYLLFSPLPWQYTSVRAAGSLPEMLVWWAMTPFWITGFLYIVRNRFRDFGVVIVFTVGTAVAYSVFHGNLGVMFRQRAQIFVFLFIFLAFGYYRWKYRKQGLDPLTLFTDTQTGSQVAGKEAFTTGSTDTEKTQERAPFRGPF